LKRQAVFHDDQHGTAIVVLAALINALKLTKRSEKDTKVVINGAGAAGITITNLLHEYGLGNIILCDTKGSIYKGR
jgi:Malic enzyme